LRHVVSCCFAVRARSAPLFEWRILGSGPACAPPLSGGRWWGSGGLAGDETLDAARGFGSARLARDLAIGLALSLAVFVFFVKLLNVNLPAGWLKPLLGAAGI